MENSLLFYYGKVLILWIMFSLVKRRKMRWGIERSLKLYIYRIFIKLYLIYMQWLSGWSFRLCSRVLGWGQWGLKFSSCSDAGLSQPHGVSFFHSHEGVLQASWGLTCMTPEDRIRPKRWKLYRSWFVISIRKRWFINFIPFNPYDNPEK